MKYELGEEKEINGVKMRRVVALIAIASKDVNPGDVGGWVESEKNLSQVSDEAWVSKTSDLLVIGPIGSREAYLTIGSDYAATGCFCGNWEQFTGAVGGTHGTSAHAKEYLAAIEFAKVRFAAPEAPQP